MGETLIEADAVLFDIDGTLVDSTAAVERTWRTWAMRYGIEPQSIVATAHGRRSRDVIAELLPDSRVQAAASELLDIAATDLDGITALPGAAEALNAIGPERWAAVTSGEARIMVARLRAAGLPVPETLVTADDVASGKPDPEGYLVAADRLGTVASRCLVVEDAPAGVSAGLASGAQVLAVATSHPPEALTRAHIVVPDLTAVTFRASPDTILASVK